MADRPLAWTIERSPLPKAVLTGDIVEDCGLARLADELPEDAALDLAGVRHINSFGVREWLGFIGERRRRGGKLVLERCSTAVVNQMNLVAGFVEGAEVRSVMLPFYCETCNREENRLLDVTGPKPPEVPPAVRCSVCGDEAEFDDVPESFLTFLRR